MPPLRTTDYEKLQQLMQSEYSALENLHATLLHEKEALENNQIDNITQIAEQKSRQVEDFPNLVSQRAELLHNAGFNNTQADIEQAIEQAPTDELRSQLHGLLQQNLELMESCQKQNQVNGVVIEVGRQSTSFILDLLQKPASETATTYNKKGQTNQSNGKPPLAKA
jgi:flagellar biosynthesis/type III secretory pathway chaperone